MNSVEALLEIRGLMRTLHRTAETEPDSYEVAWEVARDRVLACVLVLDESLTLKRDGRGWRDPGDADSSLGEALTWTVYLSDGGYSRLHLNPLQFSGEDPVVFDQGSGGATVKPTRDRWLALLQQADQHSG